MDINFFAVTVSSVLAMIIGGVWYGPLFGMKWAEIIGANIADEEARKKMQSGATLLYVAQFILTLFQVTLLAFLMQFIDPAISLGSTILIWTSASLLFWAAFVVPTAAAGAMWNNDSRQISWARFLIQSGYQLFVFLVFGIILGLWR